LVGDAIVDAMSIVSTLDIPMNASGVVGVVTRSKCRFNSSELANVAARRRLKCRVGPVSDISPIADAFFMSFGS
jgi:hypothetical protein